MVNVEQELKGMLDAFYIDDLPETKFFGQLKSVNRLR